MKKNLIALSLVMAALSGCASLNGSIKSVTDNSHKLAKDGSGIVYGTYAVITESSTKELCSLIKGADDRCAEPEKYVGVQVFSAVGFSAGPAVATSLEEKNSPNLAFAKCGRTGNSDCSYVKVQTVKGEFGRILEVASKSGEGKCYWAGLPRAGGVVCPAYNWDYRKDMNSWDMTNSKLSVDVK